MLHLPSISFYLSSNYLLFSFLASRLFPYKSSSDNMIVLVLTMKNTMYANSLYRVF